MRTLRQFDYRSTPAIPSYLDLENSAPAQGQANPGTRSITLTVLGEPVGKARARTVRIIGKDKKASYTPDKTAHAESMIQEAFIKSRERPFESGRPLTITVRAFFTRPKSVPKTRQRPIGRPDADNVLKLCLDALNRLAFEDDARIATMIVEKFYAVYPEPPRLEIELGFAGVSI